MSIIDKLAFELDMTPKEVSDIYDSYWIFVKDFIESRDIDLNISKEEFDKKKLNVVIPGLGKFYCTWDLIEALKKHKKGKNDKYKKDKSS